MKVYITSFTHKGRELAAAVELKMLSLNYEVVWQHKPSCLSDWTRDAFQEGDALVFICACGIAVRSIAPFLEDKYKDPAILVLDEMGRYVIPLVSGHAGGANQMAGILAGWTNGQAVITTATDIHGIFAVDVFAKKNGLLLTDKERAKKISAGLLEGRKLTLYCCEPVEGRCPGEVAVLRHLPDYDGRGKKGGKPELEAAVTPYFVDEKSDILALIPRVLTVGIGCKKNIPFEVIDKEVRLHFKEAGLSLLAVERIASIDLKKQEPGIAQLSKKMGVPFETYTPQELNKVPGLFTASDFVKQAAGVDNVCERAAVAGGKMGRLLTKKTAHNGVTVAVAQREWRIYFE